MMTHILAIESSCDETAAAVVRNGRSVLSNIIYSQIDLHTIYGGVVPEIASRKHIEKINQVIEEALKEAGVSLKDIDAIAVTYGPGLVGALLVGVAEAKAISFATGIPLIGVHHIEGHICANYIEHPELEPPFMSLVVSGGHTHLVNVRDYGVYEILGRTRDDAAGEAFDKVARAIGLGYPGGPKIDKVSKEGNAEAIDFPRPKVRIHTDSSYVSKPTGSPDVKSGAERPKVRIHADSSYVSKPTGSPDMKSGAEREGEYDFSFSGLKSAVLNYLNSEKMAGREIVREDVAASFQKAVTDVLVEHSMNAVREYGAKKFAIAGGVASNSSLRAQMKAACEREGIEFYYPSPVFCTDNAAMIGVAGYYEYLKGNFADLSLNAVPNLRLGER